MKSSRRAISSALSVFVGLSLGAARADETSGSWLGLSGSARSAYWNRDKSYSDKRNFGVGGLWLQARPQEVGGFKAYLDGEFQSQDLGRTAKGRGDLREAYVSRTLGNLDIRAGRQITVWGRADKVNPTDVWTVRDYTLLTTDDEDQRTGQLATQLAYSFESVRLIGVWQPEWRFPRLPFAPLPAGVSVGTKSPSTPAGQFGLKVDHARGAFDWSLSFSRVLSRTPDFQVAPSGPGGTNVLLRYPWQSVVGGDFATNLGDFGVRGELAYSRTANADGTDLLAQKPMLFSVLGVDRSFGDAWNVNLQYIYRHVFSYRDSASLSPAALALLGALAQTTANQDRQDRHGASARINFKAFHETLEAELALLGWIDSGIVRPKVTYALNDRWKATVGAEFYRGEGGSFFGRLAPVSSGFAELRWLF